MGPAKFQYLIRKESSVNIFNQKYDAITTASLSRFCCAGVYHISYRGYFTLGAKTNLRRRMLLQLTSQCPHTEVPKLRNPIWPNLVWEQNYTPKVKYSHHIKSKREPLDIDMVDILFQIYILYKRFRDHNSAPG